MTLGSEGVSGAIRTPDQRLRVFVSSTLKELEAERRSVRTAIETLHLAPVMFELGARPHPPRELYRSYLRQSDVFVGVYGDSYGWVAPGEDISGLEDEYRLAPRGMPKLIYLRESTGRDERLDGLVRRIQDDDTASYRGFSSPEELAQLVEADLAVLLAERFDASRERGAPAPAAPASPMPTPYNRLIGRGREIDEVVGLLTSGQHRVVTLLGPGRIGKSRLSLEVAAAARDHFPDGAVFVGLENVFEPRLLLPTIAYALGIRDSGDLPVEERLALALSSRRMLLVLDNFEQLVDAAAELVRLYTIAPLTSFLVTSRAVLRVRGERVYDVPPLETADPGAPQSLARAATSPAVELFVERARAVKPDFALSADSTPAVVELCRALDGLPLAIELAAARMRLLTPALVLERLHGPRSVLGDAARDLPPRQRTLRATIDWSAGLLEADERSMLCDLGVFSAGFTLDAVEAVAVGRPWAARAVEALEALIDNSLVSQSEVDGSAVFSMLVTVREYAVERLAEAGEETLLRDAHARYFLELTRRISPSLGGADQRTATRRLDLERGNLRTAVRHLITAGVADAATEIAWRLYIYWWLRGYFYEVRVWMEELLDGASVLSDHARAIARFYFLWSEMWRTDERDGVVSGLLEAGELFARSDDAFGATMAEATAGLARITMGDPDIAATAADLEHCARRFRDGGDRWAETLALIALGRLEWALERPDEAARRFAEASAAARGGGGIFGLSVATHHLARVRLLAGETDAAAFGFTEAMRMSMELDHDEGIAYAIEGLSAIASLRGDVATAAALAGAAASTRERLTMFDAPQFVYHLRYLDAAAGDDPAVAEAMARGRAWSAHEAAAYALAHVPAVRVADREMAGPGQAGP
ncbi:ATP-binding protein [Microbacterium sp. HJ5]